VEGEAEKDQGVTQWAVVGIKAMWGTKTAVAGGVVESVKKKKRYGESMNAIKTGGSHFDNGFCGILTREMGRQRLCFTMEK